MTALAPLLQAYFTERLAQRGVSPHTVTAYRDTWRLLLGFTRDRLRVTPSALDVGQLDATLIGAFLDHLEADRRNTVRTRNLRLVAIHSLFAYAALRCPEHAATIQRVLAIPTKRSDTTMVTFLTRTEADALLAAPDRDTPLGRRDHALLAVAVQTGLRVSELTALTWADVTLGVGAHLRTNGKGRKQRCTPLTKPVARLLAGWAAERHPVPTDHVFPTRAGGRLSSDSVTDLLAKHVATAIRACPSLANKNVTPHTLRHTAAMDLLQAGADTAVIALWLGHATTRSNPALPARRPQNQRTGARAGRAAAGRTPPLHASRSAARVPRKPVIMPAPSPEIAAPGRETPPRTAGPGITTDPE
jgi:site-specific recombinase XerD